MNKINQYLTYDEELFSVEEKVNIISLLQKYQLEGTEVYMNEVYPRTKILFNNHEEKQVWVDYLIERGVKRIHCSYWAYPTSFLTKSHFKEFVERLESLEDITDYYGDLTGRHLYDRWVQEYELACALGAQAYVFHVIDYAAIDGAWDFTISRGEILQAMVGMVQNFLLHLEEKRLLTDASPIIELENAGWGLEYGAQTASDFAAILAQIYDPRDKIRIGWDINHLLHAIGGNTEKTKAWFMLQEEEITPEMKKLEQLYGERPKCFAMKWLESNLMNPAVVSRTNCLHISDCKLKDVEYFRNGRLQGIYAKKIDAIIGKDAKSDYGVSIVLDQYDSHVPMGEGMLIKEEMNRIIGQLFEKNETFVLLHELKNSNPLFPDLEKQLAFLTE